MLGCAIVLELVLGLELADTDDTQTLVSEDCGTMVRRETTISAFEILTSPVANEVTTC
jgi:hypothetical protein